MKEEFGLRHFDADEDMIFAMEHFLEVQHANIYRDKVPVLHKVCKCGRGLLKTEYESFSKFDSLNLRARTYQSFFVFQFC